MRRTVAILAALVMCTTGLTVAGADFAAAACTGGLYSKKCTKVAKKSGKGGTRTVNGGGGGNQSYYRSSSSQKRSGPSFAEMQKASFRAVEKYQKSVASYRRCIDRGGACGYTPDVPALLDGAQVQLLGGPAPTGNGPVVTLTPAQAGAIAVARLRLTAAAPVIGPDPKINKWKMAVVGYPLWLWTDGPTHIGPVGENVGGLSVSLDAKVSKTVFQMGDGNSVTCRGSGTRYSSSVKPATKSPTCGYTYTKPSLPSKKYTVTAITYWDVTWTVNGFSGMETVPLVAARALPVGEVQVLRR
ncbi:MAG: hypothetical protein QM650_19115 [Microlunatus sp.]